MFSWDSFKIENLNTSDIDTFVVSATKPLNPPKYKLEVDNQHKMTK